MPEQNNSFTLSQEQFKELLNKIAPPQTSITPEQQQELVKKLAKSLASLQKQAPIVILPNGIDLLLILLGHGAKPDYPESSANAVTVDHLFFEYFDRPGKKIQIPLEDQKLKKNAQKAFSFPPSCKNLGLPEYCTMLSGNRKIPKNQQEDKEGYMLNQLFFGDVIWCRYMTQMGIPEMTGSLLQKYAYDGGLTISNGNNSEDVKNDVVAMVLETMARQTESGNVSKARDREALFLNCLNMGTNTGSRLELSTVRNDAFPVQFHRFIQQACAFYNTTDLKSAIQGLNTGKTSSATLVSIRDNISLLLKTFEPFNYNRNYYNTLNTITYLLSGLSLIYELRQTIGIPPEYDKLHEIVPMAYDILVLNRKPTPTESNRFETHFECAKNARNILLDLQVLQYNDDKPGGELEVGLMALESSIQGYRTAYRSLTGVDLAVAPQPVTVQ